MSPLQVAAEFAAFVWSTGSNPEKQPSQDEALRFARNNWPDFLPSAQEGLISSHNSGQYLDGDVRKATEAGVVAQEAVARRPIPAGAAGPRLPAS